MLKKLSFIVLLLFCFGANTFSQEIVTKQKSKRKGRVIIEKTFDKESGKKLSKKKTRDGRLIYEIHFDKKGRITKSTNRKGVTKSHKRACDC